MKVSILILTLNEEANLTALLPSIQRCFQSSSLKNYTFEVVIVDGGSKDKTVEVAKENSAKVVLQSSPGYGAAFAEGLKSCEGELILAIDADFSHPPELIETLLLKSKEADIVIASRFVKGSKFISNLGRIVLSHILSVITRIIFQIPVKDVSSGYRLYTRSKVEEIKLVGHNFDVLVEILVRAHKKGLTIV